MNYKLYKEPIDFLTAQQQILYNRGIPVEDQKAGLNAGGESINDGRAFGEKKMRQAAKKLDKYIKNRKRIAVIADADADGFCSASVVLNYFYHYYPNVKIDYILHTGKQHGLSDLDLDDIAENYDLLGSPDGASNDYYEHKYLFDRDVGVLVTD